MISAEVVVLDVTVRPVGAVGVTLIVTDLDTPFIVVTVIVAAPVALAKTLPSLETVAIAGLELVML